MSVETHHFFRCDGCGLKLGNGVPRPADWSTNWNADLFEWADLCPDCTEARVVAKVEVREDDLRAVLEGLELSIANRIWPEAVCTARYRLREELGMRVF